MIAGIQQKPVGVFWDIENCCVPKNKSPSDVIAHIRNFFVFNRLNHREYEFIISCDVTRLRKDIPEDINRAGGVTLAHVNGSSKNAADEKLRENMRKFVDTHASGSSPVLILISGDIDFVNDLRGYQTRLGCTVVLIHAANCSPQFKVGWNEIYCFTSFCSAVKDNPATGSTANSKTTTNKPFQKNQIGPPQNQKQGAPTNQKAQGGQKFNPTNLPGQPGAQPKQNDQKPRPPRPAPPGNKNEPQQLGLINQREKNPNFANGTLPNRHHVQMSPHAQGQRFPSQNQGQSFHPQNQGLPFGQPHKELEGTKYKPLKNGPGKDTNKPPNMGQQPKSNIGIGSTATPGSDKASPNKFILMVGGLPGKMDFKILKENLQFQANRVNGKVKYVKNGQAFITFKNKENADRAVELFNGKQVFGKTLNVSFTKSIPFESQPTLGSDGFDGAAEGSKKSKNQGAKKAAEDESETLYRLGSIFGGVFANKIAAANSGSKSPESCPIQ